MLGCIRGREASIRREADQAVDNAGVIRLRLSRLHFLLPALHQQLPSKLFNLHVTGQVYSGILRHLAVKAVFISVRLKDPNAEFLLDRMNLDGCPTCAMHSPLA